MNGFLPINKQDLKERGWETVDFVVITGDAYVDHPSFGAAIISRILEVNGFKVGILAQPDWKRDEAFKIFGKPRLGFLITSGNIDSMVNNYTVAKKKRKKDIYSPNGELGMKPDRGVIVYANAVKRLYKDVPILIGGLEASLRRFAHYDYWDDRVRKSILIDSNADLLMYGMSENCIVEIAQALDSGIPVSEITFVRGTVYRTKSLDREVNYYTLPSYEAILKDKKAYADSFLTQYKNTDAVTAKTLIEPYNGLYVVQNPPTIPLTQSEMDAVYNLPFMRTYHPIYESMGGVPSIKEVKFSLVSNRGCFGSCNFCALAFHQGRVIQTRSHESIINEAKKLVWEEDFKGYIHDVGGPTANFRQPSCQKQLDKGVCKHKQCLYPKPCSNLEIDHKDYTKLLKSLREIPNVKKVFVRSGIRYDYLIHDKDDEFFNELVEHHISGQLKVAPEHISPRVLKYMGKPSKHVYEKFVKKYNKINAEKNKKQFLVPYLMSSHPGSDMMAAIELAEYLRDIRYTPEQVQDFYPTPGTLSTCMYYTGIDPRTGEEVYVPKSPHEKAIQRALMQYKKPQNYHLVLEALTKCGREDLIGFDSHCLIRPKGSSNGNRYKGKQGNNQQSKHQRGKNQIGKKQGKHGQNRDSRDNSLTSKKTKKKTIRNVHKKKKA